MTLMIMHTHTHTENHEDRRLDRHGDRQEDRQGGRQGEVIKQTTKNKRTTTTTIEKNSTTTIHKKNNNNKKQTTPNPPLPAPLTIVQHKIQNLDHNLERTSVTNTHNPMACVCAMPRAQQGFSLLTPGVAGPYRAPQV